MYSLGDQYRRRAIEARQRAAESTGHSAKTAFDEIADNWVALAEQADWISGHIPVMTAELAEPVVQQQQQQQQQQQEPKND